MYYPTITTSKTPLEAGELCPDAAGSYVDYWPAQLEAVGQSAGSEALTRQIVQGSHYIRSEEAAVRFPGTAMAPIPEPRKIIGAWDKKVGSFNHMRDGAEDLVRGSALVLRSNRTESANETPVISGNPHGIVDAYLDVFNQVDVSQQEPGSYLLLAGQLAHKAAWIEQDRDKRAQLMDAAKSCYDRVHDDPDVKWGLVKLEAAEYGADIRFHELSNRIRQARRNHEDLETFRDDAATLLAEQLSDLMHMQDAIEDIGDERQKKGMVGHLGELLVIISFRDEVYIRSPLKGNHCEIRTAFPSEDQTVQPPNFPKNQRFDAVIDKIDSSGKIIQATPVQLKFGDNNPVKPDEYDEAIAVVKVSGVSRQRLRNASASVIRQYQRGDYRRGDGVLSEVQSALNPILVGKKNNRV